MPPPGKALITNMPVTCTAVGGQPVVVGPFNYPNGDRAFNMSTTWSTNVGSSVRVLIEGSLDSVTWRDIAGFVSDGVPYIDEDTHLLTSENVLLVAIPAESPLAGRNNRKARVTFTTLQGPAPTLLVSVFTA